MSYRGRLWRSLLTGVAIVFPLAMLGWLAAQAAGMLLSWGRQAVGVVAALGVESTLLATGVVLAGTVGALVALASVGEAARHRHGETVVTAVDRLLERLPVVGSLYREFRHTRALIRPGGGLLFADVAALELVDDVQVLGFVVGATSDDVRVALPDDETWVSVYVPLGPNPLLGGHVVHVPERRLTRLDIDVRAALAKVATLDANEDSQNSTRVDDSHQDDQVPEDWAQDPLERIFQRVER